MRTGAQSERPWRGVFLALVLAAISLRILTPPGFMTAPSPGGLRLVICTGHGPLALNLPQRDRSKSSPAAKADGPCIFAGGAAAPPPDEAVMAAAGGVEISPAPNARPAALAPALDLSAPPPPARAPPTAWDKITV
jgi:hypothetical protein